LQTGLRATRRSDTQKVDGQAGSGYLNAFMVKLQENSRKYQIPGSFPDFGIRLRHPATSLGTVHAGHSKNFA
jgi:hypothetical protein